MEQHPSHEAPEMCVPLPTDELGFPSEVCIEVDKSHNSVRVSLIVLGIRITVGELTATKTAITIDLGAVVSGKIGGTFTVLLHTESMCISTCFNIKHGSGKTTVTQYLVACSIFSAHPQFGFYPNSLIEVLSDHLPICGQKVQSSNTFLVKQPDTYIVETQKGVTFTIYRKSPLGPDTTIGSYQDGQPVGLAPYPIPFSIGNYYIGNPKGSKKAFTVVFRRISAL